LERAKRHTSVSWRVPVFIPSGDKILLIVCIVDVREGKEEEVALVFLYELRLVAPKLCPIRHSPVDQVLEANVEGKATRNQDQTDTHL
jgi:hypothetical protein